MLHTTWSVLGDGLVHGPSWYMADVCPVVHAGGSPSYSNIRTTTATTALTARCLLPLVLVSLCFPLVLGQSIRADDPLEFIWTSTQPTQCAEYEFFWEGGTPPFELQIAPVDNSVQPDIWVNIHNQSLIWTTDFPGGIALSLLLTDAVMSVTMNTGPIVVQPSDNDTCIPVRGTNPVTTVGIPLSSSTSSSVVSSSLSSTSLTTLASHSESSPSLTTSVHFTTRTSAEGRTSSSYRPSPLNSPSPLYSFASSSSAPSVVATLASSSTPSPISSVAFSDVPTVAGGVGSERGNRSGVLAGISIGVVAFLLLLAALVVYVGRRRSRRSQSPPLDDDDPFASTPVRPHTSASDFSVMRERRYSTPSPFTLSSQAFSATSSAGRALYCEGEAMLALRSELTSSGRTDGAPTPVLDSRASPALDGASASHYPSRAPTKTWCGESSARSETPVDALLPQSPVVGHEGSADTLSRAGTPRTAVDGGVRLAGGPLDGAVDDTDDSETLPPPYQRY